MMFSQYFGGRCVIFEQSFQLTQTKATENIVQSETAVRWELSDTLSGSISRVHTLLQMKRNY